MQNALLAVLLVTPLFGLVGTMIVNNRMAFFADSLGHSALAGIALGVIVGLRDPLVSMVLFAAVLGAAISYVKEANVASTDTIISVFASTAVALGVVILSRAGEFAKYSTYLIGDLLSITPGEIGLLAALFAGVGAVWVFIFNKLLVVSVNPSLAQSRGINVGLIDKLFTAIVALLVTLSIQWVGLLIINSLLVLPAAAARNVAGNMRQYHAVAVLSALCSGVAGLLLSYYWGTASGATIVLVCAVFYLGTFLLRAPASRVTFGG
jgi:zinc transport system permease protein